MIIKSIAALTILLLQVFTGVSQNRQLRPNVLFIAVDDLRPELGIYGNKIIKTPNIDKIAAQGITFRNHYVQVPTCGASRRSLLTGMLPRNKTHLSNEVIRLQISGEPERESPETFIHQLKRNGYYTVGIGKISHYPDGLIYGYTEDPHGAKRELPYSWDEMLFDPGKWGTGWNAFFGYADGTNRQSRQGKVKPYENRPVNDEGYPDGLTANLAVKKLKELAGQEKPFFLGVGFFKPHLPFNAPKQYWDMYAAAQIPLTPSPGIPEKVNPASLHQSSEFNSYLAGDEKPSLTDPVSDAYARTLKQAYYASVSYADAQIGKVMAELERLGLAENTIVVVWGDHGWHLGDHRVWGKHTIFEAALRSPLIIKAPQVKQPGAASNHIVSTIDLYPTIMELCGVKMPHQTDGKSLVALLKQPANKKWEDKSYSYYNNGVSLRTQQYRLTRYYRPAEPTIELYDHLQDPHENKNIAQDKPEVVQRLMPLLEKGDTGIFKFTGNKE
ncbi:iduronate-2-sulfatase [Adhaeribacter aerolatus]|uniref:Iduronate-2-sulfatase n=1 Tax=Adhaeribacter aerolatus TaxID=670289 RepID=A0A512B3C0_9BACT|nr:sulfatase [Adhaeribacter aerolatus]GEO06459.1 iduronate-2-sulfatase [Adhaeribacter aerolatus]